MVIRKFPKIGAGKPRNDRVSLPDRSAGRLLHLEKCGWTKFDTKIGGSWPWNPGFHGDFLGFHGFFSWRMQRFFQPILRGLGSLPSEG